VLSNLLSKPNGKVGREQLLELELAKRNKQLSTLAHVLCALLKEKHSGKVFLRGKSLDETLNWQAKIDAIPQLGSLRLQLSTPDGKPFIPADDKQAEPKEVLPNQPAASAPMLEEAQPEAAAPNVPSPACSSLWHLNGIGLRCPECGSSERAN
jgi:hypothetical protein